MPRDKLVNLFVGEVATMGSDAYHDVATPVKQEYKKLKTDVDDDMACAKAVNSGVGNSTECS